MTMRRLVLLFPLLLAGSVALSCSQRSTDPGASAATAPGPLRARLINQLSGYEHITTRDELERMADAATLVPQLIGVFQDEGLPLSVRLNALSCLAFFPSPATRTVLEKTIEGPGTEAVVRRPAVRAYGSAFKHDAVPLLAKVLGDGDLHTRTAAVRALASVRTPQALDALRRRLPEEPEPTIKARIEGSLTSVR